MAPLKWGFPGRGARRNTAPGAAAFEDTVLPHLDAAYNVARWLAGDPTLAEDVVQDATVRALRYFNTFRGGNARAWLLQIVRNTAHEARAKRQLHAAESLVRWSPSVGQFGGFAKLGSGSYQAASFAVSPPPAPIAAYASSGVRLPRAECGRRPL